MRGAVLRLERRVRYERIGVVGFDKPSPHSCNVASASPSLRNVRAGGCLGELLGAPRESFAALAGQSLPSSQFHL